MATKRTKQCEFDEYLKEIHLSPTPPPTYTCSKIFVKEESVPALKFDTGHAAVVATHRKMYRTQKLVTSLDNSSRPSSTPSSAIFYFCAHFYNLTKSNCIKQSRTLDILGREKFCSKARFKIQTTVLPCANTISLFN